MLSLTLNLTGSYSCMISTTLNYADDHQARGLIWGGGGYNGGSFSHVKVKDYIFRSFGDACLSPVGRLLPEWLAPYGSVMYPTQHHMALLCIPHSTRWLSCVSHTAECGSLVYPTQQNMAPMYIPHSRIWLSCVPQTAEKDSMVCPTQLNMTLLSIPPSRTLLLCIQNSRIWLHSVYLAVCRIWPCCVSHVVEEDYVVYPTQQKMTLKVFHTTEYGSFVCPSQQNMTQQCIPCNRTWLLDFFVYSIQQKVTL